MLSDLPLTLTIKLATEFENGTICYVCEEEITKQYNCDFCGKSICINCIVKRRKFNDDIWHPICLYCDMVFLENQLIIESKTEKETLTKQIEQANNELVKKRQQLYSIKNSFKDELKGESQSEKKLEKLESDIQLAQDNKLKNVQQISESETRKIELKQSNVELTQNLELKNVKLQESKNKINKTTQELNKIKESIADFLDHLPQLDAEQKSALTQLDASNYDQIFRGSNLSDYLVKSSQAQLQPKSKNNKQSTTKQECAIF